MADRRAMIHLATIATLIAAPAFAATVEDPDAPRFAEGLRVLGMRDQVEVVRITEVAALDPEPLYLARTPTREAVFRAGEDLCMDDGKLGHFVACNRDFVRSVQHISAEPIQGSGITIWPSAAVIGAHSWLPEAPLSSLPVERPVAGPAKPVAPTPVPVPPAHSLLMGAFLCLMLWPFSKRIGRWFTMERGSSNNGWV